MEESFQLRGIAASVLSADFCTLGKEVQDVKEAGVDFIHLDVMDGHFVPNITAGPMFVEAVRRSTHIPIDAHLMMTNPDAFIADFRKAGADVISIHIETCLHLHRSVELIRNVGARPGVVLNPATPLASLHCILDYVDMVLIMSVNPGFGGQKYIPTMTKKIADLRKMIDERKLQVAIEVDGG